MYDWVESRLMREALPNEHLALFASRDAASGATASKSSRRVDAVDACRVCSQARHARARRDGHGRRRYRTVWTSRERALARARWRGRRPRARLVFHTGTARPRFRCGRERREEVDGMLCDRNMWRASSTSTGRRATKFTADRGWAVFEALVTHCRVKATGAFSGLKDVRSPKPERDDAMPSFFLGGDAEMPCACSSPSGTSIPSTTGCSRRRRICSQWSRGATGRPASGPRGRRGGGDSPSTPWCSSSAACCGSVPGGGAKERTVRTVFLTPKALPPPS